MRLKITNKEEGSHQQVLLLMPALVALQALMLQEGFGFSGAATGASPLEVALLEQQTLQAQLLGLLLDQLWQQASWDLPFGAASTTGAFGGTNQNQSPFGSNTAGTFGSGASNTFGGGANSTFGKPATGFGSSGGAFGGNTNTGGAGGGLFGSSGNAFGGQSSSGFGAANNSSPFGQAQSNNAFGGANNNSPFGQSNTQQQSGVIWKWDW